MMPCPEAGFSPLDVDGPCSGTTMAMAARAVWLLPMPGAPVTAA